tara:strand:- start:248 stop:511 length:264 start_codon:yes stop_codon:yes gene_type:complete
LDNLQLNEQIAPDANASGVGLPEDQSTTSKLNNNFVVIDVNELDSLKDEVDQARADRACMVQAVSDMESEGLDVSMFRNGTLGHLLD